MPARKPSLIDRAIAALSPRWALDRERHRMALGMMGGYTGAGYEERLARWQPGVRDADGDIIRDLRELRARSRDLVRNSPIGAGAIDTVTAHVIGSGLSVQSRIDAAVLGLTEEAASEWQATAEREFRIWASSTWCDAGDELTFYDLQDLAFRSRYESGDVFAVLTSQRRPGWPHRLSIQIVEADRVCNPQFKADDETMVQGIERTQQGVRVAAHVASHHPGSTSYGKVSWQRIAFRGASGRRNLIHLTRKLRPGQTRGVPEVAPILAVLKQLTRYSDAEVDAAVNSAMFAVFAKMDPETFADVFDDDAQRQYADRASRWDGTLRSGAVVNLLPGEDITSAKTDRPNPNFDQFVTAMLRQVGVGLGIPHEVLTKSFQSSYSAARAALLDAWRTFRIRRSWMAAQFCQPIYEEFLADSVAAGRLDAPGFFSDAVTRAAWCGSTWNGDGAGSIDPEKEAKAARERMAIGLTTLSEEIIAYDGGDWETKHRQQVRERGARERDDLLEEKEAEPAPAAPPATPDVHVNIAPASITVSSPTVNVAPTEVSVDVQPSPAPSVTVEPAQVTVEPAQVTVNTQVEAPEISVQPATLQVLPAPSRPSRIEAVRDGDRTVLRPLYDDPKH